MSYKSKIKMSIGWIYPIGILIAHIFVVVELVIRNHLIGNGMDLIKVPFLTYSMTAIFFIVIGIFQWFRYKNWIYPVLGILIGFATFQGSFALFGSSDFIKASYYSSIVIIILFIVINWNSFYSHERFEIYSRRLFRLASERIYEVSDGFTERPFAAGKVSTSKDELLGFTRFLHGNYIVRPFYYENHICLAFSMNKSLLVIREESSVSHIIIDFDGNIRVKISGKDYSDYKERLSFDQLCSSMANIFVRFHDYYNDGYESRIITELKSAK